MGCNKPSTETQRDVRDYLELYGVLRSFPRGSFLYTPDDPAQSLYVLLAGQVSLSLISSTGRALTVQVLEPGQLFGHSALMGSRTYDTFAETISSITTLVVPCETLLKAVERNPVLGTLLVEELGAYALVVSRRLDEVAFKTVPSRLASVLLGMAGPGLNVNDQRQRLPRRTHQQLAEMTNAYRETVTRVINQFRADHLLDMDRSGITLLNLPRLRELAGRDRGFLES
ncbi:MAG: Crp/Fnr family transcriptional regulator [Chloroflexaceae bacterium]|nr:Crp/Fnr family transcriptional regulator [Chloroflexaceae bacterium]